ncbi:hypothetical protein HF086_004536 [Spodoptera exigua]|uniref:ABC transporter domain-containing protein n=1 Tax=Spodoptera exigua TaxID=7107 RepID=A0A922SCJ7_SPOEX|nr:hypothetical protein HF086_004536 [Spodoptera exigua]
MFRQLGELWPIFGGTLTKPPKGKLFYVPQRPYMTLGTLRDQIIYPQTREEMQRRGRSDEQLHRFLEIVQLSYLTNREGSLDAVEDWMDVLSGGEKQRIAVGISLFTVSHRKSLWKHHDHYLQMDGRGGFVFGEIDNETQEFGS